MKAIWVFLLGIVAIGTVVYMVPAYRDKVLQALSYSECDNPLQYKLGSIDSKFGLTDSQVLSNIQEATNIWSAAEGKNLFAYSPNALLTVSFVYDQRTALNNQINQLKSNLSGKDATLSQQIADYEAKTKDFEQKLAAFNAEVAKYNAQGGAPQDVYDNLTKEQNDLNAQAKSLNGTAKQLNLSTNNYNDNVSVLNGDITQFQSDLTQKPEEGLYDSAHNAITIYFVNNQQELIHTLAHEFGHALGMQHVKNPQAIMYFQSSDSIQVTPQDMQQLQYVCREQSAIVHDLQMFDIWVITMVKNLRQNLVK